MGARDQRTLATSFFQLTGLRTGARTKSVAGRRTLFFRGKLSSAGLGGLCQHCLIKAPRLLSAVLQLDGIQNRGIK